MPKENVEILLKELKNIGYNSYSFFRNFDIKEYELLQKIKNKQELSAEDWSLINGKYMFDYEFAKTMIESESISCLAKDRIVELLCKNKIQNCDDKNCRALIALILENHPKISASALTNLFHNFHHETMHHTSLHENIPQNTINTLAFLELNILNGTAKKPFEYRPATNCFTLLKDGPTLDFVLKEMPKDYKIAETIATELINAKGISNEVKDLIFNVHGCVIDELKLATPHIINELYLSAVETAFPQAVPSSSSKMLYVVEAKNFIEHAIMMKLLTESQQLDLANRIINERKGFGIVEKDETLMYLAQTTKSTDVLHFIFTKAPSLEYKNVACRNKHIGEDDIKEHAKRYCDKIRRRQIRGKTGNFPEKWLDELFVSIKKATLYPEDYKTLLSTKMASVIYELVSTRRTPDNVLKKAKDIIDVQSIISDASSWETLKLHIAINENLAEKGILDTNILKSTCIYVNSLTSWYGIQKDLTHVFFDINIIKENEIFAESFKEVVLSAIDKSGYKPVKTSVSEFKQEVSNAIDGIIYEANHGKKNERLENMSLDILNNKKTRLLLDFLEDVKEEPEIMYEKLCSVANEFAEIMNKLEQRPAQTTIIYVEK